eukprot:TRINITY_DN16372_c0_g1_i1.p1 TRINITY_DN16372_c0_g1~~TRINITY_DN16372_c0_g1_i1.p1  ORF type:complete len:319 (+),score=44.84 TRINITY_DN16372_c0_g1_i1:69-1025(+)
MMASKRRRTDGSSDSDDNNQTVQHHSNKQSTPVVDKLPRELWQLTLAFAGPRSTLTAFQLASRQCQAMVQSLSRALWCRWSLQRWTSLRLLPPDTQVDWKALFQQRSERDDFIRVQIYKMAQKYYQTPNGRTYQALLSTVQTVQHNKEMRGAHEYANMEAADCASGRQSLVTNEYIRFLREGLHVARIDVSEDEDRGWREQHVNGTVMAMNGSILPWSFDHFWAYFNGGCDIQTEPTITIANHAVVLGCDWSGWDDWDSNVKHMIAIRAALGLTSGQVSLCELFYWMDHFMIPATTRKQIRHRPIPFDDFLQRLHNSN